MKTELLFGGDGRSEEISELKRGEGTVTLKGHNLSYGDITAVIKQAIQEDSCPEPSEASIIIEIIEKREGGYTCQKYMEGEDAEDEGFTYWIDTRRQWKQGLGKMTEVKCRVTIKEAQQ